MASSYPVENIQIDNKVFKKVQELSAIKKEPQYLDKKVRILTNDGSLFIGSVIEATNTQFLLMSSIGKINIKKSGIIDIKVIEE